MSGFTFGPSHPQPQQSMPVAAVSNTTFGPASTAGFAADARALDNSAQNDMNDDDDDDDDEDEDEDDNEDDDDMIDDPPNHQSFTLRWLVSPPDAVQKELEAPINFDIDDDDADEEEDDGDEEIGDEGGDADVSAVEEVDADDADDRGEFASALYEFLRDELASASLSLAEVFFLEDFAFDSWSAAGHDPLDKLSSMIDGSWTDEERTEFVEAVNSRRGEMFDAEEDEEDTDSETEEKKDVEVTQDRLIDAVKSVRETDSGLMYIMSNFASSISERLNDVLEKYATNKDARDFSSDADLQALVAHLDIDTLETLLDEVEALDDEADKYSVQRSDLYRLSIIQFSKRIVIWLKQIIPANDERYAHIKRLSSIPHILDDYLSVLNGNYDNDQGDYDDAREMAVTVLSQQESEFKKAVSAIYHHANTTEEQRQILLEECTQHQNLMAIQIEQATGTDPVIDYNTIKNLINEITENSKNNNKNNIIWSEEAINMIREAANDYLINIFNKSQLLAAEHDTNHTEVLANDIKFLSQLSFPDLQYSYYEHAKSKYSNFI